MSTAFGLAFALIGVLCAACQPATSTPPTTTTTTVAPTTAPATTTPPTTAPATTIPPTTTTVPPTTTTTTTVPPTTTPPTTVPPATALAVKVSGKTFVDQNNKVIQLRGVNRPGTEYRCAQSSYAGFMSDDNGTDGTKQSYATSAITALKSWNKSGATTNAVNTVRIPLNEDCWLGINGAASAYSGAAYQAFINAEVTAATNAGMYAVLDLHWTAPGTFLATQQDVGPNVDHSVTFWQQVATAYKSSPSVLFDLFNEPRNWCYTSGCSSNYTTAAQTAWGCYRDGCNYTYSSNDYVNGRSSGTIQLAGTQQLVNTIRSAGANNVILIEGLGYANSMDNWMNYRPSDPANQIAAEIHTYTSSGANINNQSNLDGMLASGNLSSTYPILVGEFGEWLCSSSTTGFTENTMAWADTKGYSYTAWGWDQGEGCNGPSLVSNNVGGTASTYGAIVKAHLQKLEG